MARVLQRAWGSADMPELISSLPVTGTDGTLKFQMPARAGDDVDRNNAVLASVGPSQAICTFYDYSREDSGPAKIWTYSERPVYRPGDEVNFKAIVRLRQRRLMVQFCPACQVFQWGPEWCCHRCQRLAQHDGQQRLQLRPHLSIGKKCGEFVPRHRPQHDAHLAINRPTGLAV